VGGRALESEKLLNLVSGGRRHPFFHGGDQLIALGRRCENIALPDIAAHLLERPDFAGLFDALGDRDGIELMGQFDRHPAQGGGIGILVAVPDEALVDLKFGERQLFQSRQMRITGAEVVDRNRNSVKLELGRDLMDGMMSLIA
jgi:hypothetical protein